MRMLLRLYPRAWRGRYADELVVLAEDRRLSLYDAFDLMRGALDARLRPQVVGGSGRAVRSMQLRRTGAGGAVLGGTMLAGMNLAPAAGLGALAEQLPDWMQFVLPLCFLAAALGLYSLGRGRLGVLGRASSRLVTGSLATALVGMVGLAVTEMFWSLAVLGLLGAFLGFVLFGVAVVRSRLMGRLSVMPLLVGLLGLTAVLNGEPMHSRVGYWAGLGLWTLFALAWLLLGVALLSRSFARPSKPADA